MAQLPWQFRMTEISAADPLESRKSAKSLQIEAKLLAKGRYHPRLHSATIRSVTTSSSQNHEPFSQFIDLDVFRQLVASRNAVDRLRIGSRRADRFAAIGQVDHAPRARRYAVDRLQKRWHGE